MYYLFPNVDVDVDVQGQLGGGQVEAPGLQLGRQ